MSEAYAGGCAWGSRAVISICSDGGLGTVALPEHMP
jgi:hypothetical protein